MRSAAAEPVELGHADVHEHDVGPPAGDHVERRAPVGRLAHHRHVGLGLEDHPEARAQELLVVGDHHADHPGGRRGLGVGGRSLVLLAPAHPAGGHALGHAAQPQRAHRADRLGDARSRDPADDVGGEDLAGVGRIAEPARDDHGRAVEVVAVGERLARVQADAQQPLARRALHVHRAAHGGDRAGECDHQAVAGRLDLAAVVFGDRLSQRREVLAAHRVRGLVAPSLEQGDAAGQVGEHDRREVPGRGAGRIGKGLQPLDLEPEDALRVLEVLEPVLAHVAEGDRVEDLVVEQGVGGLGDEHLPAPPQRHDARRPVHAEPDVSLAAQAGLSRVQAHANAQPHPGRPVVRGQRPLRRRRRQRGVAGSPEREEERVALRVHLPAPRGLEVLADEPAMLGHHLPVALAQLAQEHGRSLDVREDERDGAAG